MTNLKFFRSNPYRPGAGQEPPYLAGRTYEQNEFTRLLGQEIIAGIIKQTVDRITVCDKYVQIEFKCGVIFARQYVE